MAVLGNGLEIAAGDTSPSPADDTDFGSAPVSGGQITHTFIIFNSGLGPGDLNLIGSPVISFTGPAAVDFSLVSNPTTPVPSNTSTTFQVRFDPSLIGTRAATVTIANNDSDENPYVFAMRGRGGSFIYLPAVFKNSL
jgi:hypothetical protein